MGGGKRYIPDDDQNTDMNYLISSPRSGNTMVRYILELMTRRPSNGLCGEPNPKDVLQKPLLHSGDDYVVHKRHDFKGVRDYDFVFFIIRNPLECTIRHNEQKRGIAEGQMVKYIDGWYRLLQEFHDHSNGIVFYYEEILEIGMKASRLIYPNPQSTGAHYHQAKLGKDVVARLIEHISMNWKELNEKYTKHYWI